MTEGDGDREQRIRDALKQPPASRLVPCPDCGRDVSTIATTCPQCGRPLNVSSSDKPHPLPPPPPIAKNSGMGCGLWAIVVIGILIALIAIGGGGNNVPTHPAASTRPSEDDALQIAAKQMVTEQLRDPESASFQNLQVGRNSGRAAVCGEVNAKNGFGGFTGFQQFVVTGSNVLLASKYEAADFAKFWKEHCSP